MERHEIKKTASQERKSGRVRMRPSCSTARLLQWSLLLVARLTSSGARAAGWEGWGNIRRMGQRGGSPLPGDGPSDADFDSIIQQLELDQLAVEAERVGFEVLREEVEEKKRTEILANVAKACSAGAQMTLVMGGAALLFRLLPVLFGRDLEDDEEAETNSPYLLRSAGDSRPKALPAAARRRLLTDGSQEPSEDAKGKWGQGETDGVLVAAAKKGEGEVDDGEVVVVSRRRAALSKARRLSWPFVKAMALPLAFLLAARLMLGDLLADKIDPETELLFGDDLVELYSQKVVRKEDDDAMPFAVDSQWVPGRKKMKSRTVQRPPQPEDEGGG